MKPNQPIKELFRKYIDNSINREEYDELIRFFGSAVGEDAMHESISQALKDDSRIVEQDELLRTIAKVDRGLQERIFSGEAKESYISKDFISKESTGNKSPILKASWIKKLYPYAAAAILLIVGLISYIYFSQSTLDQPQRLAEIGMDINPGSNRATLTLADGSRIELSDTQSGIIIGTDSISYTDGSSLFVIQRNEGSLPARPGSQNDNTPVQNLALTTPKGGQYQVTLPDGTKVFVNSASTLNYPSRFEGNKREVEITGEAYFQVAHNKCKPFIVKSNKQEIQVLGTEFNVSNYEGEAIITTLIEGSVSISPTLSSSPSLSSRGTKDPYKPSLTTILKPGQQAILKNNKTSIQQVNATDAIAWTRGLFEFNDVPLKEIMAQLARWYDIEVTYPKNFREERFYAEIPRDRKLSEVLRYLERSSNFKFTQKGRRVIVEQ